ncbi:NAD-dependent epimerase/dehydratase family protein [Streptomyces pinistramenti]|uniref:NAD-dependent epimerase/dehydratase family protein n=1 Tax=Streptomyces pinistramenti TaxID=2884812 RepID=UPI001D081C07|nr:NAD-dependent epimerase/dehydratase family protein [Streptomyces pinistramenti]MCB5909217.1 NAD-dependent epimerase/dehydratase family protein [Streptomyces pinistramenti]
MPHALILGGTGMIGRATALRLLTAGWQVDVTGRDPAHLPPELAAAGARFRRADRADAARLRTVIGDGTDLLVDCICYTAADARLLLPLARESGSTVLISSKAVYVDEHGNHSNSAAPPDYGGPVHETQATLAPSDIDYRSPEGYGPNKVAAEHVALDSGLPISVLRPSRVHGVGAARPRAWAFVKRVIDLRADVLLARRGTGIVQPTAAANIAALIETVAHRPGARILNSADPDAPTALDISRAVARHLGHAWTEVLLDDDADENLGRTPWDAPHPVVLDMSAARQLGYRPAGDYAATVAAEIDWLVEAARTGDRAGILPAADDPYFSRLFPYAAEDAYLAAHRA